MAQALARLLNCNMVDVDQLIADAEKRSPKEIIQQDGEEAFREVETKHLLKALGVGPDQVIALGGGAWIMQRNRRVIAAHQGFTVWLDAPFALCWERISTSNIGRPLAPNRELAQKLYDERRQFYELALFHLTADGKVDVDGLASMIAAAASRSE